MARMSTEDRMLGELLETAESLNVYGLESKASIALIRLLLDGAGTPELELAAILCALAMRAGLLDEGEPLSMLAADLAEHVAEMCASISELGGERPAMIGGMKAGAKYLTSAEMRFAMSIVHLCADIARQHLRDEDDGAGVAIRAQFCSALTYSQGLRFRS